MSESSDQVRKKPNMPSDPRHKWNAETGKYEPCYVYNRETGERVQCFPIDGREMVAGGWYTWDPPADDPKEAA